MADDKIVILARPHPFIAEHMKKFLIDKGYTPHPITEIHELDQLDASTMKGIVISTSVVSSIGDSYLDVFQGIRAKYADMPIIFATLGQIEDMIKPISHAISTETDPAKVVVVSPATVGDPSLGTKNTFMLVHKNDLIEPESIKMTSRMIDAHFG